MTNSLKVEFIDKMGTDLSVVNAARVSYAKFKDKFEDKDEKLIKFLAEHNHWSPFAHASLQFRIKAPVFVARQLVKHQVGLVWNEISRRYVDYTPELYEPKEWRGRPQNSKQRLPIILENYRIPDQDCKNSKKSLFGDSTIVVSPSVRALLYACIAL